MNVSMIVFVGLIGLLMGLSGQASDSMRLQSSAFDHRGVIPCDFTCEGANISPPLSWDHVPPNTKSFVLVCIDRDVRSRGWVHWIVYNIPPAVCALASQEDVRLLGASCGMNSFGVAGYGGPCPPYNHGVHHYVFTLYALSETLILDPAPLMVQDTLRRGISWPMIERAIIGKILAQAEYECVFERRK